MNGTHGFTLIEVMVVMGILAFIAALGAQVNMDSYRGSIFRSEANLLIMILQKARSQSVNNVCTGGGCVDGRPHGVSLQSGRYVVFQGSSYASRDTALDEEIKSNPSIVRTGLTEVVFAQLSGDSNASGTINLQSGERALNISISNAGRISW